MTNNAAVTNEVILKCQDKGLILWLLFLKNVPYYTATTISDDEIREGCANNARSN
jgi:hypothetical protein